MGYTNCICEPMDASQNLILLLLKSPLSIGDEGCQLCIISQLMVEHHIIGVLLSLVGLHAELLQGFLMLFIHSLAIWQDTVGCILGHRPHIDCLKGCGLGHSAVPHLKPAECLKLLWSPMSKGIMECQLSVSSDVAESRVYWDSRSWWVL